MPDHKKCACASYRLGTHARCFLGSVLKSIVLMVTDNILVYCTYQPYIE